MKYSRNQIERYYANARKKKYDDTLYEQGYIACESCGTNEGPIDCSHLISRADCNAYGLIDFIWMLWNLRFHCRDCHHHWENGTQRGSDTQKNLDNIESNLAGEQKYYPLIQKYKNRWENIRS